MSDPRYRAYRQQLRNAKRRDIEFKLTFEEWLTVWITSGRLEERGVGGYVMARESDRGPYAIGNVKIITHQKNNSDFFSRKTPEEVQAWKDGLNSHTPQAEIKRGASVRKVRAENYWSCDPKDPASRERWIENLQLSLTEHNRRSPRTRNSKGRFSK